MPNGKKGKLTGAQFAAKGEILATKGAKFDFSEFSKVIDGKKGPLFKLAQKRKEKFGNKNIFVLTARPHAAKIPIYEFLKDIGLKIPLENIITLENSTAQAKADWIVEKAAEGYNDFYFVDDAYKNVKAVKKVLNVVDIKSDVQQTIVKQSKSLNKEFNEIIENKTGIKWSKKFSASKARTLGLLRKKINWFISYEAEDLLGLLYTILGKGKTGDKQLAWIQKNIVRPFTKALNAVDKERLRMTNDYRALKKKIKSVPKNLKKEAIKGEGYTVDHAIRVYIWNKMGIKIPGILKGDIQMLVKYVEQNADVKEFANQLERLQKQNGYPAPDNNWIVGTITTDILNGLNTVVRKQHLEQYGFTKNIDEIFSEKNLNKLEALYGREYREALEDMIRRMKTGRNQKNISGNKTVKNFTDWLNNQTGVIMFLNTRSSVLQAISAINFINWSDNNIMAAALAFANFPQYLKDWAMLWNSDFLIARREGLKLNVSESDIAQLAQTTENKFKSMVALILKKGFFPTKIMDSFAIAAGGATFYRNRINTYIKQGLSKLEAEQKAFNDFRENAEESQQSSRPDKISQQQASPIGRTILAFANTPSQYARLTKKAVLDLINKRGDWKTNISKIVYYMFVQNLMFNALQQALFALSFADEEADDDEERTRYSNVANGMADSILRGTGFRGAIASVVKNTLIKIYRENKKNNPKYANAAYEVLKISPPLSSKVGKLTSAGRTMQWSDTGFGLNSDSMEATLLVLSAALNIPVDRLMLKVNNLQAATQADKEQWERAALILGWPEWQLEVSKSEKKKKTKKVVTKEEKGLKVMEKYDREFIEQNRDSLLVIVAREKQLIKLVKAEQEQILSDFGLSDKEIRDLKYEQNRVNRIIEFEFKKKKK